MQQNTYQVIIFLFVAIGLILMMATFIIIISFLYKRRQLEFAKSMEQTKLNHEKEMLNTQIEIQEQTFQHISREIHDNIGLTLSLAKLNLNTLNWNEKEASMSKIDFSIELLSQSILQLSDLSKSLDADIINKYSLLKAIDEELLRIRKTGYIEVDFEVSGEPVYMNTQSELIIFRIVQEAFNNIIKHAKSHSATLKMHYNNDILYLKVQDYGCGFDPTSPPKGTHSGLKNMESRVKLVSGKMIIESSLGHGTLLIFTIPLGHNA